MTDTKETKPRSEPRSKAKQVLAILDRCKAGEIREMGEAIEEHDVDVARMLHRSLSEALGIEGGDAA